MNVQYRALWQIDWLREMAAEDAAELWLHPLEGL